MRRVVGIDIHRTFGEIVFWEAGKLRHGGRIDMTRTGLEGFGRSLQATDEVVIEATGNSMAVSRVLSPLVARVIIAPSDRRRCRCAEASVLCWHLLTKNEDYLWVRPALVANKTRAMELQAGKPQKKGNRRGAAYAYNVKTLRDQEMQIAEQAERNYARFVARWKTRAPSIGLRERLNPTRQE